MGLRFLFSYRLQQFIDTTHVLRALLKLARQTRAYAHNPEFVGILTSTSRRKPMRVSVSSSTR